MKHGQPAIYLNGDLYKCPTFEHMNIDMSDVLDFGYSVKIALRTISSIRFGPADNPS